MLIIRAIILKGIVICVKPSLKFNDYKLKNIDFISVIPSQVFNNINILNKIKIILIGGQNINKNIYNKLLLIKSNIYLSYGLTETCGHISLVNILNVTNFNKIIYKVLPNINISTDKRKCLIIKKCNIYNKKIFTDDIVKIYDKNKIIWLGRYNNIINSCGIKIIPEILENKILNYLGNIKNIEIIVSSFPNDIFIEEIILFIKKYKNCKINTRNIINIVNILKKNNIYLNKVFLIDKLYRNNNHKIIRNKIKNYYYKMFIKNKLFSII